MSIFQGSEDVNPKENFPIRWAARAPVKLWTSSRPGMSALPITILSSAVPSPTSSRRAPCHRLPCRGVQSTGPCLSATSDRVAEIKTTTNSTWRPTAASLISSTLKMTSLTFVLKNSGMINVTPLLSAMYPSLLHRTVGHQLGKLYLVILNNRKCLITAGKWRTKFHHFS